MLERLWWAGRLRRAYRKYGVKVGLRQLWDEGGFSARMYEGDRRSLPPISKPASPVAAPSERQDG